MSTTLDAGFDTSVMFKQSMTAYVVLLFLFFIAGTAQCSTPSYQQNLVNSTGSGNGSAKYLLSGDGTLGIHAFFFQQQNGPCVTTPTDVGFAFYLGGQLSNYFYAQQCDGPWSGDGQYHWTMYDFVGNSPCDNIRVSCNTLSLGDWSANRFFILGGGGGGGAYTDPQGNVTPALILQDDTALPADPLGLPITVTHADSLVLQDSSTVWSGGTPFVGGTPGPVTLSPAITPYTTATPFNVSRIHLDGNQDFSLNNGDGLGNITAFISDTNQNPITSSTNTCYAEGGCVGRDLLFAPGTIVPASFNLSLVALDGIQGLANFRIFDIGFYGEKPHPSITTLSQFEADGLTAIPEGADIAASSVVFEGTLQSDSTDRLALQVEFQAFGNPFLNIVSVSSAVVTAGHMASLSLTGLPPAQYHWQARVVDLDNLIASPWQEFGASGNVDFTLSPNQGTLSQAFNFIGQVQTWVVPNNVTSITIDARGAQGGGNGPTIPGGKGGRVQTTLAVTPNQTLFIYVGGRGGDLVGPNTAGQGGFNGGGFGGIDNVDGNGPSGGGGGASDIRQGIDNLAHRVVVAGGGGGSECCTDATGGSGGGAIGAVGGTSGGGSSSGGGGTQSSGGAGGAGCNGNGGDGSLGQGGVGGNGNRAGGGGGGGYFGGGGGGGCLFGSGGGGGSSFSAGLNTIHIQGFQSGDGQVVITFQNQLTPPTGTISVSTNNPQAAFTITDATGRTFSGTGTAFSQTEPVGTYTVTFGAVPGFATPDPQTEILVGGGAIAFTGIYKPLPPQDLHGSVGNASIYLNWTPSLTPTLDGYNVYLEQFDGRDFVPLGTVNAVGVPFGGTDVTVTRQFSEGVITNGTLYRLHVTAVAAGIESASSTFVLARPAQLAASQLPAPAETPILFLHGICLPFPIDGPAYWKQTTDFLTNDLGWKSGGTLSYKSTQDPRGLPPLIQNFVQGADFYTATFGNCQANYFSIALAPGGTTTTGIRNYFGRPGILHQADEVHGFIDALTESGATKIKLVAHSMGGLAARSYLADNPDAVAKVSDLITYGTPHWGVPIGFWVSALLNGIDGVRDMTVQCDFDLLGGTTAADYAQSPFLDDLRQKQMPDEIRYVNLRGKTFLENHLLAIADGSDCLSPSSDGPVPFLSVGQIQHSLVPIDSADMVIPAHAPINQTGIVKKRTSITTDVSHTSQPGDFVSILCALSNDCVIYQAHSPIDIELTAPDGRTLTRDLTEIPAASYMEVPEDGGGTSATVILPFPETGPYLVKVVPKPDASTSDTYSLDVTRAGVITVLAQNQSIQSIPAQPYLVPVLAPLPIDIKPGSNPKSIKLGSGGKVPVAILSTADFDAPSRIDPSTLTFGHFGDESSLAFCSTSGEDVNGDGLPDLVCHFFTQKTGFVENDAVGTLKGKTKDGVPFVGTDSVRIIP